MRFGILALLCLGISHAQQSWPYLTYIGGAGEDDVRQVTSDDRGNTFVAGHTFSIGAPFSHDPSGYSSVASIYLMKIDATGRQVFSKVLGYGNLGAIAVDREGNVFVGGVIRGSEDFATSGAFQVVATGSQAFLAKFSPEGDKLFATYFGTRGSVQMQALAIDRAGRPVFCGSTSEDAVPLTSTTLFRPVALRPAAYCARMSADGATLVSSTLLGNTSASVLPRGLLLDSNEEVLVFGSTLATDFPLVNAMQPTDRRRTLYGPGEGGYRSLGTSSFGTIVSIARAGEELFVGTSDFGNWHSSDNGGQWTKLAGLWSGVLAVSPSDPRYLCTATQAGQLACSTDRGATWEQRVFSGVSGVVADPWVEGGFFVTTNRQTGVPKYVGSGTSAKALSLFGAISWVEADAVGNRVWAVVNDGNLTLHVSTDQGVTFRKLADNVAMVAAAPSEPLRLYGVRGFRFPEKESLVIVSDDGGTTWRDTSLVVPFERVQQLAVDPSDANIVYVIQGNGAFVSTNAGTSWELWAPPGLGNIAVRTMYFDNDGKAWIGTLGGSNGFAMKVNLEKPDILWSTLLGGEGGGSFTAAKVDGNGRSVFVGVSLGFDLTATGEALGPRQAFASFVGTLDADGAMNSFRYLGLPAASLDVGPDGTIHIGTTANPSMLPKTLDSKLASYGGGALDAGWITLSPDLNQMLQITWMGGSGVDRALAVHLGSDGRLRLAGSSASTDLPVSSDALQRKLARGETTAFGGDGFLAITPP